MSVEVFSPLDSTILCIFVHANSPQVTFGIAYAVFVIITILANRP